MQVTELQVQRSLEALTEQEPQVVSAAMSRDEGSVAVTAVRAGGATGVARHDLVEQLSQLPAVRDDRLEEARRRLETGERPSDEALAHRMVGRLVCDDRLRSRLHQRFSRPGCCPRYVPRFVVCNGRGGEPDGDCNRRPRRLPGQRPVPVCQWLPSLRMAVARLPRR